MLSRFIGVIPGLVSVKWSDLRWRGAIRGRGKQLQVEGSDRRWREAITGRGGGERSQVEGSDQRWREAIRGEGEQSEVESSNQRWRGTLILGNGGKRSEVEGSDRRWREAIRGKGNRNGFLLSQLWPSSSVSVRAPGLASVSGRQVRPGLVSGPSPSRRQSPESARAALSSKRVAAADSRSPGSVRASSWATESTRRALHRVRVACISPPGRAGIYLGSPESARVLSRVSRVRLGLVRLSLPACLASRAGRQSPRGPCLGSPAGESGNRALARVARISPGLPCQRRGPGPYLGSPESVSGVLGEVSLSLTPDCHLLTSGRPTQWQPGRPQAQYHGLLESLQALSCDAQARVSRIRPPV